MLLILIRRELLANLMTFRFLVAMVVTLLLVVANTVVLIADYERRLTSYRTAAQQHSQEVSSARTYSSLEIHLDRPPNLLSIFNAGLDRRLGNSISFRHVLVPTLWDTESHSADNPFLNLFSSVDLILIFQVILSLLALLFAHDAIAGEREAGTLRLTMANAVSRSVILLAKYISAMACLMLPVIMSLLLVLILFSISGSILLSGDDWLRIGGILLISIIYLSAFYLIGLLISVITRRAATALMLSMVIWSTLVLIYPSLSVFAVNRLWDTSSQLESAYREIEQIWEAFERDRIDFLRNDEIEGEDLNANILHYGTVGTPHTSNPTTLMYSKAETRSIGVKPEAEPLMPHVKAYFQFTEPRRIRAAERAWQIRQKTLNQVHVRKADFAKNLMRFSPAAMYDFATEAWAGTDFHGIEDFITTVQQYRQTIIDYFYDKAAFSSRQWFAKDRENADLSDFPQFSYHRADISTHTKHASGDIACLLLINIVLFMTTFLIFVRQEV
ncbi:ABC transporter permease subunit [Candidatus Poribacteria bacterium]|nr:ABC transporter permease subunit [Candidatus Poribacteria bacterium]MYA99981.1 ABC transporter permease subunit [Candidatus Poribacteria bacterium]